MDLSTRADGRKGRERDLIQPRFSFEMGAAFSRAMEPPEIHETQELRRERDQLQDRLAHMRSHILGALLPIADNLERAANHATEEDSVAIGVRLVRRQLAELLERQGVTRFWPIGERFAPERHEAVGELETSEVPPGVVVEVRRAGYLVDSQVLRPAQVLVAKQSVH
jgi:molecular chaperone GrpE